MSSAPATSPPPVDPAAAPDPGTAAPHAQVLLLGVTIAVVVLVCAMALLLVIRIRRSMAPGAPEQPVEQQSPWAIAGGRAEVDEDDGLGGIVIGDDDTDPNEDTWAGSPPGVT